MEKSELISKIEEANLAYAAGIPFITDEEYDLLWQQLYSIDPTNDLLYHTSQNTSNLVGLSMHKYPIYGTNKAFNMTDLKLFLTRFGDQTLVIEPKYDGCAAVITKTKTGWKIVKEGNGRYGEDITHMMPYIMYPFHLRHFQAVEIILPMKDWDPAFGKNPRNVVAGWLARKYDKPETKMTAIPHNFGNLSEDYLYNGDLDALGEKLLYLHSSWGDIYPIDGLMLKVKDEKVRLAAGNNGQTNNWSIAWKPPIQIKDTIVTDIEWNVSRLGRIIPTVVYQPIDLCHTINSRVTGNNAQWLKDKKIRIGSKISVGKAGEIIPKIINVQGDADTAPRSVTETHDKGQDTRFPVGLPVPGTGTPGRPDARQTAQKGPSPAHAILPSICPKCSEPLEWSGVHLICNGPKCIAKLIVSIAYFYSHKGIKIDGIGEATIEKLLENTKCYEVLSTKPWALLDCVSYNIWKELSMILGDITFQNIISNVEKANKRYTMAHFIAGLGLPGLAYKSSLRLCQYLQTGKLNVHVSNNAKQNFSEAVIKFYEANQEMEYFQFMQLPATAKAIYCITGTLSQAREVMIEYLSKFNYEFSSSVTRETNYLVVGTDPGKVKIEKAKKHNIPCISEEKLFNLLSKES